MPAKIIPQNNTLLLPYQVDWVKDNSRLKLMEKSRQIGISWATAYARIRTSSLETNKLDTWISSRDEIQAKLFLDDCKKFAEHLNIAANDLGSQVIDNKGTTSFVLAFANGKKIYSMSSNPDAQAGKRGTRVADEFALHKNPRLLYSIAYPGIMWGGLFEMISTHRGSGNFFNELVREIKEKGNPKKISLHTVTLEKALDQGFLYKLQLKLPEEDERQAMDEADFFNFIKYGCADEESFLQEYCCIPADDASAFLSYDLIASCEMPYDAKITNYDDLSDLKECKNLYIGVDVGRKHDLTCIWANEYTANRHLTKRVIELKNMKFSLQEEILYRFLSLPNMRRCCIDGTGIGAQFAERAIDCFGKYKVESVNFSSSVKSDLAYPVKANFEDSNVRIPFDKYIRADLRSIRKETTSAGNERFSADRGENGHADRFWALALAIHGVGKSDGEVFFAPFTDSDTSD